MSDDERDETMDIAEQEATFARFMSFLKIGTGVTFGLVLLLILIFANPF